jgi:hypothetical protein
LIAAPGSSAGRPSIDPASPIVIVRAASSSPRRRSTTSFWSPSRISAPSRSATVPATRSPSTHVPWLDPVSSIVTSAPAGSSRACRRDTLGSASRTVLRAPRPIVIAPTIGTREASCSTSS